MGEAWNTFQDSGWVALCSDKTLNSERSEKPIQRVQARERESQRPRKAHSIRVQRPVPQAKAANDHGTRYSLAQRVQVLTLLSLGYTYKQVEKALQVPDRTCRRIHAKAQERGYNPAQDPRILDHYVEDGIRPGRIKEITKTTETALLDLVGIDRNGREKSSEVLAYETGVSTSSAQRILHRNRLNSVKPTRKPGLNKEQKKARLEFCLRHQTWTLEDWKDVIWSDETSVVLSRRGS